MGVHAMGVEFGDPGEIALNVIDADQPARGLEVVLGRIDQPPVGREEAMAEEMAPLGRGEGPQRLAGLRIENDGEGARATGKGDGAARHRIESDVMAAIGQGHLRDDAPVLGKDRAAIGAVGPAAGAGKKRIRLLERLRMPTGEAACKECAGPRQKVATRKEGRGDGVVDRAHETPPKVRP